MNAFIKYVSLLLLFCNGILPAQNRKADSLRTVLKTIKEDTNKVYTLNRLAWAYKDKNQDTAIILSEQAIGLAKKLSNLKGEAIGERQLGAFYNSKKEFKTAIAHYETAIAISEKMISGADEAVAASGKKIKAKCYSSSGNIYFFQADYPKALEYYSKGLAFAEKVGDKEAIGIMCGNMANVFNSQADYKKALVYYMRDLKIAEELGNKKGAGTTLGNIASLYYKEADFPKALNYYLKALKVAEELGDKLQLVTIQGNIANLYSTESDYEKALEYYNRSLTIAEEIGDKHSIGTLLSNMAGLYYSRAEYSKALVNYTKSLKFLEEMNNNLEIARTMNNIANVYVQQGIYERSLVFYFKCLKIKEDIGDNEGVAVTLANIGRAYTKMKKNKPAEEYLNKALLMAKKIGSLILEKDIHFFFCDLYENTGQHGLALANYKKHIALRDTIFSSENHEKIMRSELNHSYEKKKAVQDEERKLAIQNQKILAEEKSRIQNVIINSVGVGLFLVLIFSALIFRSLRITRKQRDLIDAQKKEVEEQKQIAEEQKDLLEVKQKEIIDSIQYARRIQHALITPEKYIDRKLKDLQN